MTVESDIFAIGNYILKFFAAKAYESLRDTFTTAVAFVCRRNLVGKLYVERLQNMFKYSFGGKSFLKHGGNRKAAAAELGISERTLYRKLKK